MKNLKECLVTESMSYPKIETDTKEKTVRTIYRLALYLKRYGYEEDHYNFIKDVSKIIGADYKKTVKLIEDDED